MIDLLKHAATLIKSTENNDMGVSHKQFQMLLAELPDFREKYSILAGKSLEVYLARLRSGYTLQELAKRFGVSIGTIQHRIRISREALLKEFVPQHLGNKWIQNKHYKPIY